MPFLLPPPATFSQIPWFHPYLDLRERYERHINPSFNGPKDANRSDLYNRYRIGAKFDIAQSFKATLEYQNATDLFWTKTGNGITHNSDVSLAYGQYNSKNLDVSLGREKISLGEMRLIGPTEWTNLSRSFDVAYLDSGPWILWGGALGMANKDTKTVRLADLTHGDRTWGTTSILLKHDKGSVATMDEQTLDHFVTHRWGNTVVDAEAALQYGSNNFKDQRAWAYHASVGQDVIPKTTVSLEFNAASGGGNSTTNRTFDNLYPSNHDLYGLSDMTGWKNMNYLAAKVENHTFKSLTLKAAAQTFTLNSAKDGWYNYAGNVNTRAGGVFQDPTGKSGTKLGDELDFEGTYNLKAYGEVSTGVAFFQPGDFVKNLSGHSDTETFFFLQYQVKF
jgi:hypothetical protein